MANWYIWPDGYNTVDVFATRTLDATPVTTVVGLAAALDTLNLKAGTYVEGLVPVQKALVVTGPNAGIDPNTGTRVAEAIIAGDMYFHVTKLPPVVDFNGTTFDGLKFDFSARTGDYDGIRVDGCVGSTGQLAIRNCIFANTLANYESIYYNEANTMAILCENCLFDNNQYAYDAMIGGFGYVIKFQNNVHNNVSAPFNLSTPAPGSFVKNSKFYNAKYYVITNFGNPVNGGDLLIDNCEFYNCQKPVYARNYTVGGGVVPKMTIMNCKCELDVGYLDDDLPQFDLRCVDDLTISNCSFKFTGTFGSHPYGAWSKPYAPFYGQTTCAIAIIGALSRSAVISNVTVDGGNVASVATAYPQMTGLVLVSDYIAPFGALPATFVLNLTDIACSNIMNAIAVWHYDNYDPPAGGYGNLTTGATAVSTGGNFAGSQYGVRSAAGELFDARSNWWGDNSGPSGGAVDPVSGDVANGTGVLVSSFVRFQGWLVQEMVRPTAPEYREDFTGQDATTAPTATPGSDGGNTQFVQAFTEGQIPVFENGKTRYIQSAGGPWPQVPSLIGNNGIKARNAGVACPWNDNIGRFENPGKA